ncbi:MAG: hypothetical protein WD065_17315 [Planctomycetaceae bacterium]
MHKPIGRAVCLLLLVTICVLAGARHCGILDAHDSSPTEQTGVSDSSLTALLPSVDWEEVLPGRILPVMSLSVEELRERFDGEETRDELVQLLDDDKLWTVAHVVLSSLYCAERKGRSSGHSLYRSERTGLTMRASYNRLAVEIEYLDDGYCVRKTIRFPSMREQQTELRRSWERYFNLTNRHIGQSEGHERTARTHWGALLSGRVFRVGKQDLGQFKKSMIDNEGVRWVMAGFGPIVPIFNETAKEYLKQDEAMAIVAAYAHLDDEENAAIAHVVLLNLFEPHSFVRLPQNDWRDPVTIAAGGMDVEFAYGQGYTPRYVVKPEALRLVRCHWDAVFKSLNVTVIVE